MLGATLNDPRITAEQLWAGSYLWTTRAEKRQRFERHSDESFSRRLRLGIDRPPLRADGWPVTETAVAGSLQSARGRRTCAFCREIARSREPLVGQRRTSCARAQTGSAHGPGRMRWVTCGTRTAPLGRSPRHGGGFRVGTRLGTWVVV